MPNKQCILDPVPTCLIVMALSKTMSNTLARIINCSLLSGGMCLFYDFSRRQPSAVGRRSRGCMGCIYNFLPEIKNLLEVKTLDSQFSLSISISIFHEK